MCHHPAVSGIEEKKMQLKANLSASKEQIKQKFNNSKFLEFVRNDESEKIILIVPLFGGHRELGVWLKKCIK